MVKKAVHSKDPRKPSIVAAFKALTECSKVTGVVEIAPDIFTGYCMAWDSDTHKYTRGKYFSLRLDTLGKYHMAPELLPARSGSDLHIF